MTQQAKQNKKLIIKLVAIVFGMFGFGFALVPLYDVFCDLTGLNGKTSNTAGTAALYLNKTECFCFEQQILQAGEKIIMPMRFYVDPQIPKDMTYFTVQYTLYDVTTAEQQVALNQG